MYEGKYNVPKPINEPILGYLPGSKEKKELKEKLLELKNEKITIPIIIDGKEITTEKTANSVMPHNHQHILAEYYQAGTEEVKLAINAALNAKKEWEKINWIDRAAIFLKAADLLAGPYRST
ncbi:MAG: aldehyde dehydrogenase family protein, partial [Candidatus Heimdallarchaeaceae archaeon]